MSKVLILGAGASAGYENSELGLNPPVTRCFFRTAATLFSKGQLQLECFPRLSDFLQCYYRTDLARPRTGTPDVEEVLTMIDVSGDTLSARRELLRLITEVLEKVILGQPCEHHERLLATMSSDDTVITFNWDLLVDNLLAFRDLPGLDYGSPHLQTVPDQEGRSEAHPRMRTLKLHGSLNWMRCLACEKCFAFLLQGKTAARHLQGLEEPCPTCRGCLEPMIIPPTLLKEYRSPVFEDIWNQALAALGQAEEITVVGYSLPPTDFRAKWLFIESAARRTNVAPSLRIIDRHPCRLVARYAAAFHVPRERIESIPGTIKDVPCPGARS